MADFRSRLRGTLRALRPLFAEPGVLVIGSEVPNLLLPPGAEPIVISQDVDVGVPVGAHAAVKRRLGELAGFRPSADEPSVWLPPGDLLEVNFLGLDEAMADPTGVYVLEDPVLPLLVFGALSVVRPGATVDIDGVAVPLPRPAGLLVEKLLTDRTGEKGDRDRLVALGLLLALDEAGVAEFAGTVAALAAEQRHAIRASLTILSLMDPRPGVPDPRPHRARVAALLRRIEEERA